MVDAQKLDATSPARWLTVGNALASNRRRVRQNNTKDDLMVMQKEATMLAPHDWPKPVKHILLTGATLLVILAYVLLCAGSAFLTAALFSQISP